MANVTRVGGLIPVRHLSGSPWNGATMLCSIASGDGTATFVGDAVKSDSASTAVGDYVGIKNVVQAAAGDTIYGVITQFLPDYSDLSKLYRLASTQRYCLVCIDPDVVFRMRTSSTVGVALADVGLNGDIEVNAGNTTLGTSGMEFDSDGTPAMATSSAQLRIFNIVPTADNEIGTSDLIEVVINEHELKSTTGVA